MGSFGNRPDAQRKSLLELDNHHCRWPVGYVGTADFFFCGDPSADVAGGVPYCSQHRARAYGATPLSAAQRQARSAHARKLNAAFTRNALFGEDAA